MGKWNFLTNHALVLIHIADHPHSTLREIAGAVGITERAALTIVRSLEEEGIVARQKEGRRNRYTVDFAALLNQRVQGPYSIAELAENIARIARRVQASRV